MYSIRDDRMTYFAGDGDAYEQAYNHEDNNNNDNDNVHAPNTGRGTQPQNQNNGSNKQKVRKGRTTAMFYEHFSGSECNTSSEENRLAGERLGMKQRSFGSSDTSGTGFFEGNNGDGMFNDTLNTVRTARDGEYYIVDKRKMRTAKGVSLATMFFARQKQMTIAFALLLFGLGITTYLQVIAQENGTSSADSAMPTVDSVLDYFGFESKLQGDDSVKVIRSGGSNSTGSTGEDGGTGTSTSNTTYEYVVKKDDAGVKKDDGNCCCKGSLPRVLAGIGVIVSSALITWCICSQEGGGQTTGSSKKCECCGGTY